MRYVPSNVAESGVRFAVGVLLREFVVITLNKVDQRFVGRFHHKVKAYCLKQGFFRSENDVLAFLDLLQQVRRRQQARKAPQKISNAHYPESCPGSRQLPCSCILSRHPAVSDRIHPFLKRGRCMLSRHPFTKMNHQKKHGRKWKFDTPVCGSPPC